MAYPTAARPTPTSTNGCSGAASLSASGADLDGVVVATPLTVPVFEVAEAVAEDFDWAGTIILPSFATFGDPATIQAHFPFTKAQDWLSAAFPYGSI